jgi:hypothetical protein
MWPMVVLQILYLCSIRGGGASDVGGGEPLLHYLVLFKWTCHLTPQKNDKPKCFFYKRNLKRYRKIIYLFIYLLKKKGLCGVWS